MATKGLSIEQAYEEALGQRSQWPKNMSDVQQVTLMVTETKQHHDYTETIASLDCGTNGRKFWLSEFMAGFEEYADPAAKTKPRSKTLHQYYIICSYKKQNEALADFV